MIFEKIAQAKSLDEVQEILIRTHVFLGGRDRPDLKELSSTIGLTVSQMLMRPTFEQDFVVFLEKMERYLHTASRFARADMTQQVFNTTAVTAPDKYCFVVNSWQAAASSTFVTELENSLLGLVDQGFDIPIIKDWIDELSQSRPNLWDDIKTRTLTSERRGNYHHRIELLVSANKIYADEVVAVFNKMSETMHGAGGLNPEEVYLAKTLINRHNISLEGFIDRMYACAATHNNCTTAEFLNVLTDFVNNPETPAPSYPSHHTPVFESLVHIFGTEISPKYTAGMCAFHKCYSGIHKPNAVIQEWLTKMPYEKAIFEARAQKSDTVKKKIM